MQRVLVVFVLAFAADFPVAAQVLYGSLTGIVHDAAGAFMNPNSNISAANFLVVTSAQPDQRQVRLGLRLSW